MDYYASGVLNPDVHARLVANIENIAADVGIQSHWITAPLIDTCGPQEIEWTRQFKFHAVNHRSGLVLTGRHAQPSPVNRMAAIAGALTRNFVACRVTTLNAMLALVMSGEMPDVSCLLVPNFFTGKAPTGGASPGWRTALLLDALLERHAKGQQTVLYVSDEVSMGMEYGEMLRKHLEQYFSTTEIG
jgi:hypothetical protein